MPTRTGNILRAAEGWPERTWAQLGHRLAATVAAPTWSRARTCRSTRGAGLGRVRCRLGAAVLPLRLLDTLGAADRAARGRGAAFWVPNRAETFGDLMEAAYDLYRISLYEQLRWPLPQDPDDEVAMGEGADSVPVAGHGRP